MTDQSNRSRSGFRALRENPDIWAVAFVALLLLTLNRAGGDPLRGFVDGMTPRPFSIEQPAFAQPPLRIRAAGAFRFHRITLVRDLDQEDASLEAWTSRLEMRRERLWQRLEEKMRRLEERFEAHQLRMRTRCVSIREE